MKGKVLWWNAMQLRGFIISEGGQQVYFSALASPEDADLDSGDGVTFDQIEGPDGPYAINVVRAKRLVAKAGDTVDVGGGMSIHVSKSNANRGKAARKAARGRRGKRKPPK